MPTSEPSNSELWQQKGDLAASTLDFRRRAAEALDRNIVQLIRSGAELGTTQFETAGKKRPCLVAIAIGDRASTILFNAMELIHKQLGENPPA